MLIDWVQLRQQLELLEQINFPKKHQLPILGTADASCTGRDDFPFNTYNFSENLMKIACVFGLGITDSVSNMNFSHLSFLNINVLQLKIRKWRAVQGLN